MLPTSVGKRTGMRCSGMCFQPQANLGAVAGHEGCRGLHEQEGGPDVEVVGPVEELDARVLPVSARRHCRTVDLRPDMQ